MRLPCCAVIMSVLALSLVSRAAEIVDVGDLTGGSVFSTARAVSADGSVVVGDSQSTNGQEAYRWTRAGGISPLGDLAGGIFQSIAHGVSGDGAAIFGYSSATAGNQAFRWTSSGGMVGLAGTAGSKTVIAYGANTDGTVAVGDGRSLSGKTEGFRWVDGTGGVGLDPGGATFYSIAWGVSGDGSVVVGESATISTPTRAFRWSAGTGIVSLGTLGTFTSDTSKAFAISADGSTIVGETNSSVGVQAFRYTLAEGMVGLGDIPGSGLLSRAYGVSGDGSIIVGQGMGSGNEAFIWDAAHGVRSLEAVLVSDYGLNMTGWQLDIATAISADGTTIVGNGFHNGNAVGWVATIPEPGTIAVTALFAVMLMSRRAYRRNTSRV